jgi:hypothetical protein
MYKLLESANCRAGMIGCFPLIFDAELSQLCSYCRKAAPEDADDLVANLGCREWLGL